ncbi:hypothetical protein [Desulfotomaculum sp. 1211_IL3151]|uniref:hypothetical protein n=1 Tax=Desulfotomaculum sp. 1211_IL3151 TaxID=3084055 RepID=UPI002FD9D498
MRTVKVWSYEVEAYIEKESIGQVRYVGDSFEDITSDKIYDVLSIEEEMLRVVDDEEMDYLYSLINPAPLDMSSEGGTWKIIKDEKGILTQKFKELKLL